MPRYSGSGACSPVDGSSTSALGPARPGVDAGAGVLARISINAVTVFAGLGSLLDMAVSGCIPRAITIADQRRPGAEAAAPLPTAGAACERRGVTRAAWSQGVAGCAGRRPRAEVRSRGPRCGHGDVRAALRRGRDAAR